MISEEDQLIITLSRMERKHLPRRLGLLLEETNSYLLRKICQHLSSQRIAQLVVLSLEEYRSSCIERSKGGFFIANVKKAVSDEDDMLYATIFRTKRPTFKKINVAKFKQNDEQLMQDH